MKRFVSTFFVLALLFSATAFSQGWTFKSYFPDTTLQVNTGGHGIAVSPDGKVWFQAYGTTDSILQANGTMGKIRVVYVWNSDGSKASFAPIKTVTVSGVTDTLWNSSRGMREDNNGNILFTAFDALYRLDYKTGQGMNKFLYPNGAGGFTGIAPAVDAAGDIFIGPVSPGTPIQILGTDFSLQGNAVDSSVGYSRTLEVSKDGNTIYWCGYTNNAVFKYTRTDIFSPFVVTDTLMKGFACESITWNPANGYLWASSGNIGGGAPPNGYPGVTTSYTFPTWYAWDTKTWTIKDSINWQLFHPTDDARPRGLAFSPDGNTAYVTCFGASNYPAIEKYSNPHPYTDVQKENPGVVTNYDLSQNYPNPFNPSTEISYSVAKPGFVTLKVYDLLGKEVATLVNQNQSSGNFTVNFNANRLASGTYIYQLNVNGVVISKKMTLLK